MLLLLDYAMTARTMRLWRKPFMNRKNETTTGRKRRNMGGTAIALVLMTGLALAASVRMNDSPSRLRQKERRYELRGTVKSVDKPNRRATIKHEKVGDYMDAMTMPFLIKDEKALNTIQPGDQIKATLVVTDDGGLWLENVSIMSKGNSSLEEKIGSLGCAMKSRSNTDADVDSKRLAETFRPILGGFFIHPSFHSQW
jgi:Cu/Ag efflux protein CusF